MLEKHGDSAVCGARLKTDADLVARDDFEAAEGGAGHRAVETHVVGVGKSNWACPGLVPLLDGAEVHAGDLEAGDHGCLQ